jgi:hypothetical protein
MEVPDQPPTHRPALRELRRRSKEYISANNQWRYKPTHLRRRSKEKRVDLLTSATDYIATVTVTVTATREQERR